MPFPPSSPVLGLHPRPRSSRAQLVGLLAAGLLLLGLYRHESTSHDSKQAWARLDRAPYRWLPRASLDVRCTWNCAKDPAQLPVIGGFDTSLVLNFDTPQSTLLSQLKADTRYVITESYGGYSNQILSIFNLLYYAKLSERVTILPSLAPSHFSAASVAPMSTFFDLPLFYHLSRLPIVQLSDLKPSLGGSPTPKGEILPCWSIHELFSGRNANVVSGTMAAHNVWLSMWALPRSVMKYPGGQDLLISSLVLFDFNKVLKWEWVERVKREFIPQKGVPGPEMGEGGMTGDRRALNKTINYKNSFGSDDSRPPVDQLACYDTTLFLTDTSFKKNLEKPEGEVPAVLGENQAWIEAGQFMHFNPRVEELVDQYLATVLEAKTGEKLPPYIGIHLRRGDFGWVIGNTEIGRYVSALERVVAEIQRRLDAEPTPTGPGVEYFSRYHSPRGLVLPATSYKVVVTTDEAPGTPFWNEVIALGWKIVDHQELGTEKILGGWWGTVLDSAILSRGEGFVGTPHSTFSHLASVRTKYWKGGSVDYAW